jgi:hypothetical protein
MADWTDNIPELGDVAALDADELPPLAGYEDADAWGEATHGRAVNHDGAVRVFVANTTCIDTTAVKHMAAAQIGTLPGPSEAVHLWIGGLSSMGHVLSAVLELAEPATITDLHIATLTFSKANAEEWAGLVEEGKVATLTVVTSVYFERTSPHLFGPAVTLLRPLGATVATSRCHAKLLCARLSDGRTITAEGSANTRSARTLEQVTLFGSPQVYDFHATKLNTLVEEWRTDRANDKGDEEATTDNLDHHTDQGTATTTGAVGR